MGYPSNHYGIMKTNMLYGLLFILIVNNVAATTNSNSSWYEGCYLSDSKSAQVLSFRPPGVDLAKLTAARCSQHCHQTGYQYAGVQRSASCMCTNTTLELQPAPDYHCNNSCGNDEPMPCGDTGVIAVYSTLGPYLSNLTIEIDHTLVVGPKNQIEVIANYLAAPKNVSAGWPVSDPSVVVITWSIDGSTVSQTTTAIDSVAKLVIEYEFKVEGQHLISVTASNKISTLTFTANYTAILPRPIDLEVALLNDSKTLPTCIPRKYLPLAAKNVAVFVNQLVAFEVSLTIGVNLTFTLKFSDAGSSDVIGPYQETPPCSGRNCMIATVGHTFNATGRYSLQITVENVYGKLEETMDVVVVDHILSNLTIRHDPSAALLSKVNIATKFYVKVTTASRMTSYLSLNFGEGTSKQYYLWDEDGDMIGAPPSGGDFIRLTASYDSSCLLSVEVDHVFQKQGVFVVGAECYNNHSRIAASLGEAVTILRELLGATLSMSSAVKQNVGVNISAILVSTSVNMTYSWGFTNTDRSFQKNFTTSDSVLSFKFPKTGIYTVSVIVSNLLGSVSTSGLINVQDPITGLAVSSSQKYIRVNHAVNCSAVVVTGTAMKFTWTWADGTDAHQISVSGNTSQISHIFTQVGQFNGSVKAENLLNEDTKLFVIVVQEAVAHIMLSTLGPVALGNVSTIVAKTTTGTDVKFDVDFGNGRIPANGTQHEDNLHIRRTFSVSGSHMVTVFAYNNVSEVKQTIVIMVEVLVQDVTILTTNTLVMKETAIIVAKMNGSISQRQDILYWWQFCNQTIVTKSPMIHYKFMSAGDVVLNVTVKNLVSSSTASLTLHIVENSSSTRLLHAMVFEYGVNSHFTLINVPITASIDVKYGDQSKTETFHANRTSLIWKHTYNQVGFYKMQISVFLVTRMDILWSIVSVQERITALSVSGPAGVPLLSLTRGHKWTASLGSGTDVVYKWSFDGAVSYTAYNVVYHRFTVASVHNISVRAMNSVSAMDKATTVIVQHPVSTVDILVSPVVHGHKSTIEILVTGGKEFFFDIRFGDGTETRYSSSDPGLGLTVLSQSTDNSIVPQYKAVLLYTYGDIGDFVIRANVSNHLNWIEEMQHALVDEPIGGVVLMSDAKPYIQVGTVVGFNVTAASGNNLTFVWNFGDNLPSTIESYGNYSVASHQYSLANIYNISVSIKNPLYSQPIVVYLPFLVKVIIPISQIVLKQQNSKTGAPFDEQTGKSVPQSFVAHGRYGSNIVFHFDFGDGTVTTIAAKIMFPATSYAVASHAFPREGGFQVKVTASNDLGNVTVALQSLFWVQIPPGNIGIQRKCHSCPISAMVFRNHTFTLITNGGTNVSYNWNLGDGTTLVDKGPVLTYMYRKTGDFHFNVKAYNKADEKEFGITILVQQVIQACTLTSSKMKLQTSPDKVTFTATPSSAANYYTWDFGVGSPQMKFLNVVEQTYSSPGSYVVKVTASNYAGSSVISDMVVVRVFAPVKNLNIKVLGYLLLNASIKFEAQYYSGTNLTLTWNFGDGNGDVNKTGTSEIEKIFTRKAQYNVTLTASNDVSSETVHMTIFVLDHICHKPEISFLGMTNGTYFPYKRSNEIRIEIDSNVNCSTTAVTIYQWHIFKRGTRALATLYNVSDDLLSSKMLLFNPLTLEYGNYTVEIMVHMGNGSIVHEEKQINITVAPSPILPIITGGILRNIPMTRSLTLDGSQSYDPDYPYATDMSFNWTCHELNNARAPCFKNGSGVLPSSASVVALDGSAFIAPKEYVVTLTISRPGRTSRNTTQVLKVSRSNMLTVQVRCPRCLDGPVNSNYRIEISAECSTCQDVGAIVTYKWDIYILSQLNDMTYAGAHDVGTCVEADGSSYVQYWKIISTTSSPNTSTTGSPASTDDPAVQTTASSSNGNVGGTSATQKPGGTGGLPFLGVGEGSTGGRGNRKRRSKHDARVRNRRNGNLFQNVNEGSSGSSSSSSLPGGIPIGGGGIQEGSTSGRGDGQGTGSGSTGGNTGTGGSTGGSGNTNGGGDPVVDPFQPVTVDPHIVSQPRYKIRLLKENTTTGLDHSSIVFRPGFLKQGRTYMAKVNVTSTKDGKTESGAAEWWFEVNESPNRGQCTFQPREGIEEETVFRIFCHEWRDRPEDTPFIYKFTYHFPGSDVRNMIYGGQKPDLRFNLPAGLASQNHRVLVEIAILDRRGAQTSVCQLPITVKPKDLTALKVNGRTEEDILLDQYKERDGIEIREAIQKKDVKNFHNKVQLFVHKLNRAPRISTQRRQNVKNEIFGSLKTLSIRDEYEALQTGSTVLRLTDAPQDINRESLRDATDVLAKFTDTVEKLETDDHQLAKDLLTFAVESSSNIIEAATMMSKESKNLDAMKYAIEKNENSMHELLNACTRDHTEYEEAVQRSSALVKVKAQGVKGNKLHMVVDDAEFYWPMKMHRNVGRMKRDTSSSTLLIQGACYQAHMILFSQDPYVFKAALTHKVTAVASLNLYHCNGTLVPVKNLPADQLIHISIPRKPSAQKSFPQLTLNKKNMSLHKFNFSHENLNHSFHIVLKFERVPPELRKFPVAILINHGTMPTPDTFIEHKRFSAEMDQIEMRIPAGRFNATGDYYLGIVDANYNKGRPRDHLARQRNYTLKMWWESCVFWDSAKSDWSPEGCSLKTTSTYEMQHCVCNHLTSFGAHFSLAPNDLSLINVDAFFDLHQNPVMIAFVIAVLLIYAIAFAVCYRYDSHDLKKGGVVYLQDNTATDRQRYEVIVETGFRKGAGTTSKVSVVLHGEEGMSETRELLNENNQMLFERNSRDIFVLTLPDSLGPIWKVQFWHNNNGVSPSWYLSRVIVRDINLDSSYYFQCEKWFAVEEEDGKVEQEFMSLEGGLGFRKIVWIKGTEFFTDYHLWGSLFTRPSYSRFLRTDRLTCCLSLLMSYMCLNAMWYQTNETEYRGEFGLIDVSWRAVVVGLLTTVIVVPINLTLVMMFRKTKLRKPKSSTDKKYRSVNKDNHSTDGSSTDNFDRSVQPVMTQSLLDQSILNWQSLQEWAQKQWTKRYQQSVTSSAENVRPEPVAGVQEVREPVPVPAQILKGFETDQTSSGFEDYSSQQVQTPPLPPGPDKRKKSEENSVSSAGIELIANDASKHLSPCLLPWGSRYILLIVSWLIIAGCATVTIMYGFRFGRTKSIQWLQSLFFSFMMCVFITHPIVILIITIYSAVKYRNTPAVLDHTDDDRDIEVREKQRPFNRLDYYEDCDDLEKGIAARQRSRYLRFARPPQEKQLIESRKKTMKEKKAVTIFWETVKYLIVLTVALFVAFGKDTTTPYHLNKAVTVQFADSLPNPFRGVKTVSDWWSWSQSDLLDRLYWETWYNGQDTNTDRNYILGGSSTIVGLVNLRQLRVQNKTCEIPHPYNVTKTCYYGYGTNDISTASYGPGEKWTHSSWSDLYRYRIYGRLGEYDGTGFLIKLNSTRAGASDQLKQLKAESWIDRHTRAIIVEFTLYNAPTNLFTSVSLVCETPATGGAFPLVRVDSAYMYRYFSVFDHVVLAFELIFISIIMFKIQTFIGGAIREKRRYFKDLWNILHLVQLIICVTYIVCYVLRFVYVHDTIERLRATFLEEYVDVFFIALWDELMRTLVGCIVFIIFIQFLRLLRYRKLFARFGNVYRRARWEILIFTAMFVCILMAYTCLGVALFRTVSWSFSEFHLALMSLSNLLVLKYRFQDIEDYSLHGARIFVCVFFIFGMGTLLSYIVAVLSLHFRFARHDQVLTMSSKELMNFYWNRFLVWLKIRRITQDDDDDSVLPPEFTMAEIEYQVDELLFKMNAISGSHGLPEKPPCYYTDSDCTYGMGDDGVSSGGSEGRFDEMRFESRIAKIEDNLYTQEPHLAQLIQLDNIGTDILSQDRENQLRSQLELEIFRQLQLQRQEGKSHSNTHYDGSNSSALRAADINNTSGKLNYHDPFLEDYGAITKRRARLHEHRGSLSHNDMYDIPVHGGKSDDYGSCEVVSMDDETVTRPGHGHIRGSARLGSGIDKTSRRSSKYSHSILDLPPGGDILDIPIHRLDDDDYPGSHTPAEKSRPFDYLYDSSSSSEFNIGRSRSAKPETKPRSLRKTKSRGKGKGRKTFTPIKGLDELGVENGGYSSDSDVNVRVRAGNNQKQCW